LISVINCYLSTGYERPSVSNISGVSNRVDWCETFPGIEQPNEAYSAPVLNKSVAYETTTQLVRPQPGPQYEEIQPGDQDEYEIMHPAVEYENIPGLEKTKVAVNYINIDIQYNTT